jgi:hypothetical protein
MKVRKYVRRPHKSPALVFKERQPGSCSLSPVCCGGELALSRPCLILVSSRKLSTNVRTWMRLFHAQRFHWIDRGRFLRGDDTSKHGSESKREYTSKKEQRIPTTDLIQLGGNQAGTSNRT